MTIKPIALLLFFYRLLFDFAQGGLLPTAFYRSTDYWLLTTDHFFITLLTIFFPPLICFRTFLNPPEPPIPPDKRLGYSGWRPLPERNLQGLLLLVPGCKRNRRF